MERERDSSFNLGESALYAEAFVLGQDWPTAANQYPPRSARRPPRPEHAGAPTPNDLRSALDSPALPDLSSGAQWTIRVRDNGSPTTGTDYDSSTDSQPNYDANGDGKLWVRADGVAKGRSRSIVGLLQLEELGESVAQNVITAGHFYTSNNGNKVIVDTQGNSATGSQVVVRCTPDRGRAATPAAGASGTTRTRRPGVARTGSTPCRSTPNAMTPAQVAPVQGRGDRERHLLTPTLPAEPHRAGRVRGDELHDHLRQNTYKDDYNTARLARVRDLHGRHPGPRRRQGDLLRLRVHAQPARRTSTMTRFIMHANGTLAGGVSVDGKGGVEAGSDKFNIIFDGAGLRLARDPRHRRPGAEQLARAHAGDLSGGPQAGHRAGPFAPKGTEPSCRVA